MPPWDQLVSPWEGKWPVSFPSHSSHLILERYQDSDLPLTSTEGTDTKGHTPHFITQRQAMVACQTIPLAGSQKPGYVAAAAAAAAMSWNNRSSPPLIWAATLLPTSMHSCVSIYNELRAAPGFYSEEIGSPITLSSFLQLNTDQLMTTNETLRDIHAGILEWSWEKEGNRIINYELQLAANPNAQRHFCSHVHIDTS